MRKHLLALLASAALTIGGTGQVMAHEFDEDHDATKSMSSSRESTIKITTRWNTSMIMITMN